MTLASYIDWNWVALAFVLVPNGLGQIAGFITLPSIFKWYNKLKKPAYDPPNWLFGPAWSIFYTMIGYASYLVWSRGGGLEQQMYPLTIYAIQLAMNISWQLIFFLFKAMGIAQFVNLALLAMATYTARLFAAVDPLAGKLFVPYILWVGFANVLNYGIWKLNPEQSSDGLRPSGSSKPGQTPPPVSASASAQTKSLGMSSQGLARRQELASQKLGRASSAWTGSSRLAKQRSSLFTPTAAALSQAPRAPMAANAIAMRPVARPSFSIRRTSPAPLHASFPRLAFV